MRTSGGWEPPARAIAAAATIECQRRDASTRPGERQPPDLDDAATSIGSENDIRSTMEPSASVDDADHRG